MTTRALVLALATMLVLVLPPAARAQTLSTYDAFSDPEIDPLKWRGQDSVFNASLGPRNTEVTRRIANGQLELFARTFGAVGTNVGVTGNGNSRVLINHPQLVDGDPRITAVQFRVTPKAAQNDDCPDNTSQGQSRARFIGFFFNDGTGNATSGDLVGDILAGVNIERNSKLGDRIVAFISRCDQAPCSAASTLKFVDLVRPAWQLNTPETVTIRWRKATKDFQYTVASTLGTETKVLSYGDMLLFDSEAPKATINYQFGVNNNVLNCAAGRREGHFNALFDNIRLNADAVTAATP